MSVNKFRFGIRKAVGTPSAEGAMGTETLASHTSNPSAHADYVRKNCIPRVFDETEHLLNKTVHASNYLRRDEVMTSHMDYILAKDTSYTKDSSNYTKEDGVKRHVVTAFVLRQVLDELGLLGGTTDYLAKSAVVRSDSGTPLGDWDELVPSYKLLQDIGSTITANNNAMQKSVDKFIKDCGASVASASAVASSAAATANSAAGHNGYVLTADTEYVADKTYYVWDPKTSTMFTAADIVPGAAIPADTVYEKVRDVIRPPVVEAGYARSEDTEVITGKTYYKYDYKTGAMAVATVAVDTNPAEADLWELLTDLTTRPMAHAGYALTQDRVLDPTKTYYVYNYASRTMEAVGTPTAADITLYWEKLVPRGVPFPDWSVATPTALEFVPNAETKATQYNAETSISGTVFLSVQFKPSNQNAYMYLSVATPDAVTDEAYRVVMTIPTGHDYDGSSVNFATVSCTVSFRAEVGTHLRFTLSTGTFEKCTVNNSTIYPDKLM